MEGLEVSGIWAGEAGRLAATALQPSDGEALKVPELLSLLGSSRTSAESPQNSQNFYCTPPSWRKSAQIARLNPPAGFWSCYFQDLQFPGGKYEIFFDITQVGTFLRPPREKAGRLICRRPRKAVETSRMVQERCFRPECEERGILAESVLQNAIYRHDLETPGARYRGALKTVEVPVEGLWIALNGPN